jgi:N-acetylmuramoyl-L-alanine amidase
MKDCNTTGTAAGSYSEAQFNWEVAQKVVAKLRAAGATVLLTRDSNDGWGPCIDQRGLLATNNHADLLLSIHADGSTSGHHGFHVIHPGLIPGYTDATVGPSARLATAVRDSLVSAGFSTSNYVGSAGLDQRKDLGTLNRAGVPAVIVESGNMANAADIAMLRSADGQSRLADAFLAAIASFAATR